MPGPIVSMYGLGHHSWDVTREDYSVMLKVRTSLLTLDRITYLQVVLVALRRFHRLHPWRLFREGDHSAADRPRLCRRGAPQQGHPHLYIGPSYPIQTLKTIVCIPIRAYWDPTIPRIGCLTKRKLFLTDLTVAAVVDLIILILPIPVTYTLRLPLRTKLKIVFMLSAGSLATGVTIFRLVQVAVHLDPTDISGQFAILDVTTYVLLSVLYCSSCIFLVATCSHFSLQCNGTHYRHGMCMYAVRIQPL